MALTERLALLISADVNGAVRGLEKVGKAAEKDLGLTQSKLDKTAKQMQRFGAGALGAAGLAAAGLYKAGEAASDLEQAMGGTEAVFGEAAGSIDKFAKSAAKNAGLSERAFREATTSIGGQLKRMTGDVDFAADKSVELTQVAADLAATYGGTTADAVQALGAAFRGEADPAERFNLNLKASVVSAKAVELGLAASTSAVDENARAQAILALVTEQSSDAQGQFAREAGSAAGSMQTASAEIENAMAGLGEAVAPIIADVAGLVSDAAGAFTRLNDATGGAASKVAVFGTALVGAVGGASLVVGKIIDLNRNLRDTDGNATRASRAFGFLGRAAATVGVLTVAVEALNAAIPDPRKANLTELQQSLLDLGETGKVVGEAAIVLGADFGVLRQAIEDIADPSVAGQIGNVADEIITFGGLIGGNRRVLEESKAAVDALDKALAALAETNPDAAAMALTRLRSSLSPDAYQNLLPLLDDYNGALGESALQARLTGDETDEAAGATAGYTGEVEDWTKAQEEATSAVEDAVNALKDLSSELKKQFDPLFGMIDAQVDLAEAQQGVADAAAEYGRNSPEYQQALVDAAEAALGFEAASLDLAAGIEAGEISLDDARAALGRWVQQGSLTEAQAQEIAEKLGLVTLQADNVSKTNPEFTIRANGVDAAVAGLDAIVSRLIMLDGTNAGYVVGSETAPKAPSGTVVRLKSGGPVPGARDQPVPITAHGGEFVLSADVVDAIVRGAPTRGLPGRSGASEAGSGTVQGYSGPTLAIENFYAGDRPTTQALEQQARRIQLMAM